jgi:hypothetical protein
LSGMFFKGFGLWVAHAAEAIHFESSERARQFAETERVIDVKVHELTEEAIAPQTREAKSVALL